LIEEGIKKGRYDSSIYTVIRALTTKPVFQWLSFILVGLHTLEEMGGDYKAAFYSQIEPVKVTYLGEKAARALIENPCPDFDLAYAPELVTRLLTLTNGQPFLLQRICWELVELWNERFLEARQPPERRLQLTDLDEVLDADFFMGADYYFSGVWGNAGEEERKVLALLARSDGPLSQEELARQVELAPTALTRAIADLRKHDIIPQEGPIRFAAELMHAWVWRAQVRACSLFAAAAFTLTGV